MCIIQTWNIIWRNLSFSLGHTRWVTPHTHLLNCFVLCCVCPGCVCVLCVYAEQGMFSIHFMLLLKPWQLNTDRRSCSLRFATNIIVLLSLLNFRMKLSCVVSRGWLIIHYVYHLWLVSTHNQHIVLPRKLFSSNSVWNRVIYCIISSALDTTQLDLFINMMLYWYADNMILCNNIGPTHDINLS